MASGLLLSAGTSRFEPEKMKQSFDRLEGMFKSRIDMVIPFNKVRVTDKGQVYFDVPNKLIFLKDRTFTQFSEAEAYLDEIRAEGDEDSKIKAVSGTEAQLELTGVAKSQLLERVSVPVRYANKQAKDNNGDLVWRHIQDLLLRSRESGMCRILDNHVRAFVSTKYRPIDSLDVLKTTMVTLKQAGADIMEVRVWGDKFQMVAVNPNLEARFRELLGDTPVGHRFVDFDTDDAVNALLEIENDEAGGGGLNLMIGVYSRGCTNTCLIRKPVLAIRHSGVDMSGSVLEGLVLTAKTRQLQAQADISKLNDAVAATFSEEKFKELMNKFKTAANDKIEEPLTESAVKAVIYASNIPRSEFKSIYEELMASRDLTRYGLIQAVTRIPDAGRDAAAAHACDRAGGDVLNLESSAFDGWIKKNAKSYDNVEEEEGVLI